MASAPTIWRSRDGDTVDLICWRAYGRRPGAIEAVLDANPGLADHAMLLPVGTRVVLPAAPAQALPVLQKLWD